MNFLDLMVFKVLVDHETEVVSEDFDGDIGGFHANNFSIGSKINASIFK